jgi:acyl-CoA hydrolase
MSLVTGSRLMPRDLLSGVVRYTEGLFRVVATDANGRPMPVPPLEVTTDEQRRRWQAAEQRRAVRLGRPVAPARSST